MWLQAACNNSVFVFPVVLILTFPFHLSTQIYIWKSNLEIIVKLY